MATPAANPVKQRYTAGSCALEIVLQPSALSQWSERLVTDAFTFRLWLAEGDTAKEIRATKRIVAEGDHLVLQAIAQYIQNKTRQTLAVPALGTSLISQPSSDPDCPPEFQQAQPIGYLQLCDLNTVLAQYEQGVLALPAATEQTSEEHLGENIILLEAVRDRRAEQAAEQETNITLPSPRKKKRVGLWAASSAAAALLAVGLTTALRSRNPALQEFTTANNTAASNQTAEIESAPQAESSLQTEDSSQTETLEDFATGADSAQADSIQLDEALPTLPPVAPSSGRTAEPLPRVPTRPERNQILRSTRDPVAQASGAPLSTPSPVQSQPTAPPPATPPNSISTAPISPSGSSAIAPLPPVPESSRDSLFSDQFETASEPNVSVAESNAPSDNHNASNSAARSQAGASSADSPQASSPPAVAQSSRATPIVSQVQNYFQQRWQGGNEAALVYELTLSADGSVADFTATSEAAELERDRLFSSTAPPSFSANPGAGASKLRILLNGDGTVQVIETR